MTPKKLSLVCLLVLCGCWRGCGPDPDETADTTDSFESDPPDDETAPPAGASYGMARYAALLVHDGARIEETYGDETTWGDGYSDAYGGPTAEIIPEIRARLVPEGALAKPGYATGITITAPGNVDLLLGARTPFGHFPSGEGAGLYRPVLPTIFELLRASDGSVGEEQAVFTANSVHLQALNWSLYPGMGEAKGAVYSFLSEDGTGDVGSTAAGSDDPVIDDVAGFLLDGSRLVVANLHQVDRSGHYNAVNHWEFIADVDVPLVELWEDTVGQDAELADNTVLVYLSDHGRHRFMEGDSPWAHHGDGCSGCREIPILLLGPGIQPGIEVDEPYNMEDVTATVAWLMGFELPYGTGMVMTELLVDPPEIAQRTGPARLASSGEFVAYQQWRDDLESRSEIVVDDTVFSDTDAFHVEEPRLLLTGEGTRYLCWRQVEVGTSEEFWNWIPVCKTKRESDSDWHDVDQPAELVWPYSSPALAADAGGRLTMAWSSNLTGSNEAEKSLVLDRWTASRGWEGYKEDPVALVYFPTRPALAVGEVSYWVAWGGSTDEQTGRYERKVEVYRVSWPSDGAQTWSQSYTSPDTDSSGRSFERQEDPALYLADDALYLAYLGFNSEGNYLLTANISLPDGDWGVTRSIDTSGTVFAHIPPVWSDDGHVYWARLASGGTAEVCRASTSDLLSSDCLDLEVPYIESLAASPDGAWATRSSGDKQWELTELSW